MKDLSVRNARHWRESEEDIRRWKDVLCLGIGRINLVKMAIQPKAISRFNSINQKPRTILHRLRKQNLKIYVARSKVKDCQCNLDQK